MRRAFPHEALVVLAGLAFALPLPFVTPALAAPVATLKVTPIPIPGFPGTGNILGAGAEVETRVTISGSEYGGFPSPLTGITFYAPTGVQLTTTGFPDCVPSVLEARGVEACPKGSLAGPVGEGLGVVSFGSERVDEKVSIHSFFAPAGGLTFFVEGRTPASFEILEKAHWVAAVAPYAHELIIEVPLVQTVPGADDASILSFKVVVGAAYRKAGKTVSYITLPKKCPPSGSFSVKAELMFMSGEAVTLTDRQPCPRSR